jgi:hypothetical protein
MISQFHWMDVLCVANCKFGLYLEKSFKVIVLNKKAEGECRLQWELGTLMTADFGSINERPIFMNRLQLPSRIDGHNEKDCLPSMLQLVFGKESGIAYYSDKGPKESAFLRTIFEAETCVERGIARGPLGTTTILVHLPVLHTGDYKVIRVPDLMSQKYKDVIVNDGMAMFGTNIIIDIMVKAGICTKEEAEAMCARGPRTKKANM